MTDQQQQTSVPYSPDVVRAHDAQLVWRREFGTNSNPNTGDPYVTTAAVEPQPVVAVNTRTAMLEINSFGPAIGEQAAPRGNSFLIPEWSTFPNSPFLGSTLIVIYCKLLLREVNLASGAIPPAVDLIMAGPGLIGHANTEEFALCTVDGANSLGFPGDLEISEWTTGPLGPSSSFDADQWGRASYFRILAVGDGLTNTAMEVWHSVDGLTWNNLGSVDLPTQVLRRLGLSVRGFAIGALDWMRVYTYPNVTALPGISTWFIPPIPETGDKLFIP